MIEEVAERKPDRTTEPRPRSRKKRLPSCARKLHVPGDWYVIHTYSGHERKVKANLEQRITTQNMKTTSSSRSDEYVMEYRGNAKKRVRHVRIPGYAIVCMDFNGPRTASCETPAVAGFVGDLAPCRSRSAGRLLLTPNVLRGNRQAAKDARPRPGRRSPVRDGEIVTVTDGPFETMSAVSEDVPETQKLRSSSPSSSETPLELGDQVESSSSDIRTRTWDQARNRVMIHFVCVEHYAH